MSGHNKWSSIKHTKAKNDAQNAKLFTKIGREIAVAVKEGGPDPNSNSKLKTIIAKAKSINMPNDNISRSIKKASGENGNVNYEGIVYEGYGPAGSAVIVETLTDNKNRTGGEVRHLFDKFGGSLGQTNCVSYLFSKKGIIYIEKGNGISDDDMMMHSIEANADDCEINDTFYKIVTTPENFEIAKKYFETQQIEMSAADLELVAATYLDLEEDKLKAFIKLIDALNDNDDVQEVYHNVNLPDCEEE